MYDTFFFKSTFTNMATVRIIEVISERMAVSALK